MNGPKKFDAVNVARKSGLVPTCMELKTQASPSIVAVFACKFNEKSQTRLWQEKIKNNNKI